MIHRDVLTLVIIGCLAFVGCAGPPEGNRAPGSEDPILQMLEQGIVQLDNNIERLNEHISEMQTVGAMPDPTVQELHALDLAMWQLQQQQWRLQREHLNFTASQIRKAQHAAGDRSPLGEEWASRRQAFVEALDNLRTHRRDLERKRQALEAKLVERYFQ
jgi:chromosome segregation ATPase